jgi:hypothetical protein
MANHENVNLDLTKTVRPNSLTHHFKLQNHSIAQGTTNFSDVNGGETERTHVRTEQPHPLRYACGVICYLPVQVPLPCETVTTVHTVSHASLSRPVHETVRDRQAGHSFAPSCSLHI